MDRAVIEAYIRGGGEMRIAVAGLTADDLNWAPPKTAAAGLWSIRELVVHVHDAEAAFADRIKRVIATPDPVLLAWDENAFASHLHYEKQSAEDAVFMMEVTRRQIGRILQELPETAFDRAGMHSERGRQTLKEILGFAVGHADHHLKFVRQKRALLKK